MNSTFIFDKRVFAFDSKDSFLEYIKEKKVILIAMNAEKLLKNEPDLEAIVNSNIGYADGIGAVWALRKNGLKSCKIPGAEFWLDIINAFHKHKSVYLIGGEEKVLNETLQKLKVDFPGIVIDGYHHGFFDEEQKENIMQDILAKQPDLVFVAMGSPKQEYLMNEFFTLHPAIYMGLGGSFDVYSGKKKRAPKIFIDLGLEWFYRLLKEPTRISRQINLLKFAIKIIFDPRSNK